MARALSSALALSAWLVCTAAAAPSSGVTLLKTGAPLQRFDLLKPGVHRYVRYTAKGKTRTAIDIWTRRITLERRNGRRLVHITQHWDEVGRPITLDQDSWFEATTLVPITHVRTVHRDGKVEFAGYRFLADRIVGMADLPGNARKNFYMAGLPQRRPEFVSARWGVRRLPGGQQRLDEIRPPPGSASWPRRPAPGCLASRSLPRHLMEFAKLA